MAGVWAVKVTYELWTAEHENVYGTFRSETAATRFARDVRGWADSRTDRARAEVRQVRAEVFPVTKPALEFVMEDVARLSEVSFVSRRLPN